MSQDQYPDSGYRAEYDEGASNYEQKVESLATDGSITVSTEKLPNRREDTIVYAIVLATCHKDAMLSCP